MDRKAYPVKLRKAGVDVLMVELRPSELVNAMREAGNDQASSVRGRKVSREALRMSIRKANGEDVSYVDLQGSGWKKYFPRTRHLGPLTAAWAQVHLPGPDEIENLEAGMDVELDGDAELWTVTLPSRTPGGAAREVVLAERDEETVDAAIRAAEAGARSEAAQAFLGIVESVKRALRSVDGKPVSSDDLSMRRWDQLFTVRETYLLGHAFTVIHGGDEDLVVGEGQPVSGTA